MHWPHDEIESATNIEASERIDCARDGHDALARWPHRPQVAIYPIGKEATLSRSLARLLAPSGIRSYHSFDSASASIRLFAWHADDERAIGRTTHRPLRPLIPSTSAARARASGRAKALAAQQPCLRSTPRLLHAAATAASAGSSRPRERTHDAHSLATASLPCGPIAFHRGPPIPS